MRAVCFLLICALAGLAQQPATGGAAEPQQLAAREFGPGFTADPKVQPLFGDLDGDGQEDAVIVAGAKNPLSNAAEFHYTPIDPYDAYFGFGDPKITVQFSATNATETRYVLVIHNWRAPKAKFVIINLPFDRLSLGRASMKKKTVVTIHADEAGGLASDTYWAGKKYKWEPSYFSE